MRLLLLTLCSAVSLAGKPKVRASPEIFSARNWWPKTAPNASGLSKLLPAMDAAPGVARSAKRRIDVSPMAAFQHTALNLPATREGWLELQGNRSRGAAKRLLDELLLGVLPHVKLAGSKERRLGLEDVAVFGFMLEQGGQLATIHWDNMWSCYPDAAGFQLWYMVDPPSQSNGKGNMFLLETSDADVFRTDLPIAWNVHEDGSALQRLNLGAGNDPPIKHYSSVLDVGFKFEYLDFRAGEALIMGKRSLHVSDFRTLLTAGARPPPRSTVVARILVLPRKADTIPVWPGCPLFKGNFDEQKRRGNLLRAAGDKMHMRRPERHAMMFWPCGVGFRGKWC
jgi:hypothetical protein